MTTPEQIIFAAQQVYDTGMWRIVDGIICDDDPIAKFNLGEFDPENNAEQRWDMVELVWDSGTMIYKKDEYYVIPLLDKGNIKNKSIDEALILAACALGGFEI